MDFVNDVNFVTCLRRGIIGPFDDIADVIDAGIGGGIHFNDVHGPAFGDRLAHGASVTGFVAPFVGQAVDGFSQDATGGGLAGAARATKR